MGDECLMISGKTEAVLLKEEGEDVAEETSQKKDESSETGDISLA